MTRFRALFPVFIVLALVTALAGSTAVTEDRLFKMGPAVFTPTKARASSRAVRYPSSSSNNQGLGGMR
jgi:hypothetical protein